MIASHQHETRVWNKVKERDLIDNYIFFRFVVIIDYNSFCAYLSFMLMHESNCNIQADKRFSEIPPTSFDSKNRRGILSYQISP